MASCESRAQFEPVERLAQGSFGQILLVRNVNDGRLFAVKEINLQEIRRKCGANSQLANDCMQVAFSEAEKMIRLQHPNIVRVLDAFQFTILNDDIYHIVMEYCEGGSLEDAIREGAFFDEATIRTWIGHVTSALAFLHKAGIAHRDVKTENVFLFDQRAVAKLGHFGIAQTIAQASKSALITAENCRYSSPEWCDGVPYGFPNDIWALGIVTFKTAALKLPFDGVHDMQVYAAMKRRPLSALPPGYSPALSDFVDALLQVDAITRPKVDEVGKMAFLVNDPSSLGDANSKRLVDELVEAAGEGDEDEVVRLLKQGVDVNAKSPYSSGCTALHEAARQGRFQIAHLLISNGADVNARNNSSETPIVTAARYGHTEIVDLLLDKGSEIDSRSNFGVTALFEAARTGRTDVVSLLIGKGANVLLQTNYGETARMEAQGNGHPEIVALLDACT